MSSTTMKTKLVENRDRAATGLPVAGKNGGASAEKEYGQTDVYAENLTTSPPDYSLHWLLVAIAVLIQFWQGKYILSIHCGCSETSQSAVGDSGAAGAAASSIAPQQLSHAKTVLNRVAQYQNRAIPFPDAAVLGGSGTAHATAASNAAAASAMNLNAARQTSGGGVKRRRRRRKSKTTSSDDGNKTVGKEDMQVKPSTAGSASSPGVREHYQQGDPASKTHVNVVRGNDSGGAAEVRSATVRPELLPTKAHSFNLLDFLLNRHPRGIGVVLGVGRNPLALDLLQSWHTSPGLYLVDPFIHIYQGYDEPENLSDIEHQRVFEDLRNKIHRFEGRYSLMRDFSESFAVTWRHNPLQQPPPPLSLVYIDNNPAKEAVLRDLSDWWQALGPGGIICGPNWSRKAGVQQAVSEFAAAVNRPIQLFQDQDTWFLES